MGKILVAIPADNRAMPLIAWVERFVAALASPPDVTLLHVVPTLADYQGIVAGEIEVDLASARAVIAELLRDRDDHWQSRILAGEPGPLVCEAAREFDWVVIGRDHRSALQHWIFGGTAEHVLRHSPVPVLVAAPDREEVS